MPKNKLLWILTIVPSLLCFKVIFLGSSMVAGDAPFLTSSVLEALRSEPAAWVYRGTFLGGVNQFLWISPYMFLISAVEHIFSFSPEFLIRIFFYIPAILSSVVGMYFFTKKLKLVESIRIISTLIYTINTYFLLVVDGGQVGVALAYGLFPIVLSFLYEYVSNFSKRTLAYALIALEVLTIADPRVALLSLFTVSVLLYKRVKWIALLLVLWALVNAYWLYPALALKGTVASSQLLQLTSFVNGIFFYAPHWPSNIYGAITYPTILFLIFPLFVIINFFKKSSTITALTVLYLICIFAVKGTTEPLGKIYEFIISLPLGSSFRDSTKFFIPLSVATSILVSIGVYSLSSIKKFRNAPFWIFYILFLISISPALLGKMNFVLSGNETSNIVENINSNIDKDTTTRIAWIPEKDPRGFESKTVQSVDAKDLVNLRPFARLNVGSSDKLNFINNSESNMWLDLFGINMLVYSGNPRTKTLTEDEIKAGEITKNALLNSKYLSTDDSIVYKNAESLPRVIGVKRAIISTYSDKIYEDLANKYSQFNVANQGMLFIEDGKWNPEVLSEYASSSAVLIGDTESKQKFTMSLLQKYFVGSRDAKETQFASYSSNDYLTYKYELLIRDINYSDFDYNRGISFSSQENEHINFEFTTSKDANYLVAVRSFSTGNKPATLFFNGTEKDLAQSKTFEWTIEKVQLSKGTHALSVKNRDGLTAVNVVALIPESEFVSATNKTDQIYGHFPVYEINDFPVQLLQDNWVAIPTAEYGTSRWKLTIPENVNWITFTDTYSSQFGLFKDRIGYMSLPFYSATNGFYHRPEWTEVELANTAQEQVRWGMYFSALSLLIIILGFSIKFTYGSASK